MPTALPNPTRPEFTVVTKSGGRADANHLSWMMDQESPTGWSLVFQCSGSLTVVHSSDLAGIEINGAAAGEPGAHWCGACDAPLTAAPAVAST